MTNAAPWALAVSLALPSTVLAQDNGMTSNENDTVAQEVHEVPVVEEQQTEAAKHALSRCLVGEVDWGRPTEYAILSHILAYRTRLTGGRMTFEEMASRYCSVLHVRDPSPRQEWVRNLPAGEMTADPGFPSTVDWHNYVVPWRHVREFVDKFMQGRISNPLPSARHWGSVSDGKHIRGAVMLARVVPSIEDGQPVQLANVMYTINPSAMRHAARPVGHGVISARLAMGRRGRIGPR